MFYDVHISTIVPVNNSITKYTYIGVHAQNFFTDQKCLETGGLVWNFPYPPIYGLLILEIPY